MEASDLTHGAFAKQFGSRQALIDEVFELAFQQAAEAWTKVLTTSNEREAQEDMLRFYFQERPGRHNCPTLMFALSARETSDDSGAAAAYRHGVEKL